jgi:hypothetical protein
MFNFFKLRNEHIEDIMKEIKDSAYVAPVDPVSKAAECYYTVGTTDDGKVVFKVGGDDYTTSTLTMNETGTRQLIRMLTAALPEQEEE